MSLADILAKHQAQKTAKLAALPVPRPSAAAAFNFLISSLQKKPISFYGTLNEGYEKDLTPSPCENIWVLLEAINKKVKLSESAKDCFIVMMATAISLRIDGPFLWTHITGPSGSLKSTLLKLIGTASDRVFSLTKFNGFYSGSTVGGRDNSLVPQIQDKLFMIHDFTPIIQESGDTQNEICGDFRVIYEGEGQSRYKNGVTRDYRNVRFACLTGVTHVIYNFRRSDMGERFSIFDINSTWSDDGLYHKTEPELDAEGNAYDSIFNTMVGGFQPEASTKLDLLDDERRLSWGLLNHLFEHIEDTATGLRVLAQNFKADRRLKSTIDALAVWLEHGRCNLPPKGDPYAVMSPAEPHRSIKILSKYAMAIAIVLGEDHCSATTHRILRKLCFDTGKSKALQIMNCLACTPRLSRKILGGKMQLSDTWVAVWCDHLIDLGVIREEWQAGGGPGRQTLVYTITERFRLCADTIGLHIRLPKAAPQETGLAAVLAKTANRPFGRRAE